METAKEWKQNVYEALLHAEKTTPLIEIADECGVSYQSLRSFKQSLHLGKEKSSRLENWLREHNFLKETALTIDDAKLLLRSFLELADNGMKEDHFWRLLKLNITALLREMPPPETESPRAG